MLHLACSHEKNDSALRGPCSFCEYVPFQFIPVIKAELLQSSVSRDPPENIQIFWFAAQETFIIINAEHFLWKRDMIFVDFLMNKEKTVLMNSITFVRL